MLDRESDSSHSTRFYAVILDYGTDAEYCADDAVEISERGMRLRSRWHFEIGTQLSVSLVRSQPRLGTDRVAVEAIAVWCEQKSKHCYESTLLFLELPDDLKQQLREFSFSSNTTPSAAP